VVAGCVSGGGRGAGWGRGDTGVVRVRGDRVSPKCCTTVNTPLCSATVQGVLVVGLGVLRGVTAAARVSAQQAQPDVLGQVALLALPDSVCVACIRGGVKVRVETNGVSGEFRS